MSADISSRALCPRRSTAPPAGNTRATASSPTFGDRGNTAGRPPQDGARPMRTLPTARPPRHRHPDTSPRNGTRVQVRLGISSLLHVPLERNARRHATSRRAFALAAPVAPVEQRRGRCIGIDARHRARGAPANARAAFASASRRRRRATIERWSSAATIASTQQRRHRIERTGERAVRVVQRSSCTTAPFRSGTLRPTGGTPHTSAADGTIVERTTASTTRAQPGPGDAGGREQHAWSACPAQRGPGSLTARRPPARSGISPNVSQAPLERRDVRRRQREAAALIDADHVLDGSSSRHHVLEVRHLVRLEQALPRTRAQACRRPASAPAAAFVPTSALFRADAETARQRRVVDDDPRHRPAPRSRAARATRSPAWNRRGARFTCLTMRYPATSGSVSSTAARASTLAHRTSGAACSTDGCALAAGHRANVSAPPFGLFTRSATRPRVGGRGASRQ